MEPWKAIHRNYFIGRSSKKHVQRYSGAPDEQELSEVVDHSIA